MTPFETLVQTPLAKALGWTLFHSMWEGALAALVLAAVLFLTHSPRVRYAAACLAMAGMLAGFAVTLARLMPRETTVAATILHAIPRAPLNGNDLSPDARTLRIADILPWLAPFWVAGVILFHLRGMAGWMAARRLRRRGVCSPPDPWPQRLNQLRDRLRVAKPVALLETCLAEVPVVIGYLRPVILIPVGLLAGMPAAQVEAILLHELAHIRRRDYLVNLLQTVVEGFLFYHPAIWWMSAVIRNERENCCDDLVVAASGNAHAYATALANLEQTRWAANEAALAATGGNLMKRIHRLLYQPKGSTLAPLFSAGVLTIAVAGALAAWQAGAPSPAAAPAPQQHVSPYTRWLDEDVVYIIDKRERTAFLGLQTDSERVHFIQQFWERRNPNPGSLQNAFQLEHYRRIAYANQRFAWRDTPGWKTDRGRIYIVYGPPDEIESHPDGEAPTDQWLYHTIKGIGTNIIVEFRDRDKTGDFRMTEDPNKK